MGGALGHSRRLTRPRPTFRARVLMAVRGIPVGRITTYGDVAAMAGAPRAARAVGNIMRDCRDPSIPCHRVVASNGGLAGFGGGVWRKKYLLDLESKQ